MDFRRTLRDCRDFAADAYRWSLPGANPHISRKRCDSIIELAFLRAFLAWETFLEESFVLYLLGHKPPRGRVPHRFTFPPNRKFAEQWVIPEHRPYATWNAASVIDRAQRFFRDGRPFTNALRANQSLLDESKIIRNAMAHKSRTAYDKFENLVRIKLGTLPLNLSVGNFLGTIIPGSSPPLSFLEFYLNKIEFIGEQIVPEP
jgi:hypothetical protein